MVERERCSPLAAGAVSRVGREDAVGDTLVFVVAALASAVVLR